MSLLTCIGTDIVAGGVFVWSVAVGELEGGLAVVLLVDVEEASLGAMCDCMPRLISRKSSSSSS